ncbi:SsrA-binding protein [Thiohalorhabdus denitrificans]|uniref:SsrA-binding protein n=1 Tax=Thiohalorhabdus denitrificans TaxID=381306 RepID=A0A0P9CFA5_9GAMM|nr:SsrA-binding protein SmpB [Thiohalorhabdus denitrificans]KPV41664.1 SsrA-binding protein [Thiohalorhabdus denitrificans]SCY56190.1 SsrA-binding protein [Thiohalorhabdus denitrificans]
MGAPPRQIAQNKKARFDFHIEEEFEAGIELQGWEVKALRAGRANIKESHVIIHHGEAWLVGARISPLPEASTHVNPDPTRTRRLLLHARQLRTLIGQTQQKGFTIVALDMHWTRGLAKVQIALAKGKKKQDKRADIKERDWQRQKERIIKEKNR